MIPMTTTTTPAAPYELLFRSHDKKTTASWYLTATDLKTAMNEGRDKAQKYFRQDGKYSIRTPERRCIPVTVKDKVETAASWESGTKRLWLLQIFDVLAPSDSPQPILCETERAAHQALYAFSAAQSCLKIPRPYGSR